MLLNAIAQCLRCKNFGYSRTCHYVEISSMYFALPESENILRNLVAALRCSSKFVQNLFYEHIVAK